MSEFVQRYAWWLLGAHGITASTLYTLAAHYPLRAPWIVSPGILDDLIPLVPDAAWVYASYLLLLPVLVLFARHRTGFSRVFVTATTCALVNAVIYIVFPTSLVERTHAPAGTLLAAIQHLDSTLCAVPSGHVALPASLMVASRLLASEGPDLARIWRPWARLFALWTVLLAGSTLFTKQHYLVDVAAGALYGGAAAFAAAWLLSSRDPVRWRVTDACPNRLDEAA